MRTYFPSFNFVQNNAYRVESPDNPDKAVVIAGSRGWNIPSKDTPEADVKIYKRELIRLELSLSYAKSLQKEGDKLIAMLHYPPFEATYQDTEVTALVENTTWISCCTDTCTAKTQGLRPPCKSTE